MSLAFIGGSITVTAPARAADITLNAGGIAFGYSDGYWDRNKQWHEWRDREEAERFRRENQRYYFDRRHDRVTGWGWRDHDRYWERNDRRFNSGVVAFAFVDGYWDRDRQWHRWRSREDAEQFRRDHRDRYVNRRHDQEHGWGWRDDNRWWERR